MRTYSDDPGPLFILLDQTKYWADRLFHPKKYRQHEAYQRAFDAWQDGTGPMPDFKEYYR
jgi:hypothetical protein